MYTKKKKKMEKGNYLEQSHLTWTCLNDKKEKKEKKEKRVD